jgi:altronate dehydratase small subunit
MASTDSATESQRRVVQRMHPSDNVATALRELQAGTPVPVDGVEIAVRSVIPFGHKVALHAIEAGSPVLKYGEAIGVASANIAPGEHVHTHNVESQRGRGDLHR